MGCDPTVLPRCQQLRGLDVKLNLVGKPKSHHKRRISGGDSPEATEAQAEVAERVDSEQITTRSSDNSIGLKPMMDTDLPTGGRQGPTTPCERNPQSFSCPECDRSFSSKAGRSLHLRKTHAEAYHAQAQQAQSVRRSARWTESDVRAVAAVEAELRLDAGISIASSQFPGMAGLLAGRFPERTETALKQRRTKDPKYLPLVQEYIDRLVSSNGSVTAVSSTVQRVKRAVVARQGANVSSQIVRPPPAKARTPADHLDSLVAHHRATAALGMPELLAKLEEPSLVMGSPDLGSPEDSDEVLSLELQRAGKFKVFFETDPNRKAVEGLWEGEAPPSMEVEGRWTDWLKAQLERKESEPKRRAKPGAGPQAPRSNSKGKGSRGPDSGNNRRPIRAGPRGSRASDSAVKERGCGKSKGSGSRSTVCEKPNKPLKPASTRGNYNPKSTARRDPGDGRTREGTVHEAERESVRLPPNRRDRRRKQRRDLQRLFRKSPSTCIKQILDSAAKPDPSCDLNSVASEWGEMFGKQSVKDDRRVDLSVDPENWGLAEPLTSKELLDAVCRQKPNAPGEDRVEVADLRVLVKGGLLTWLNLFLYRASVPSCLVKGVTSLIPKKHNAKSSSDFRPITVMSKVLRVFHTALGTRLSRLGVSSEQRGFRPVDGCFENAWAIRSIIKHAKVSRSNLCLAFVDIANAFGSVSHESVLRAAAKSGVPQPLVKYVSEVYLRAATVIRGQGIRETHRIRRGILQGDPLSSVLFNLVIDHCFSELDPELGFPLPGTGKKIGFAAFADDTVLLTEGPAALRTQTSKLERALSNCGMTLKPPKCATLQIGVDRKVKRWFCDDKPFLAMGPSGAVVRALGVKETYRYLGVNIGPSGTQHDTVLARLKCQVDSLTRAMLNPQQRLYGLRVHIVPGLLHELVLGDTGQRVLRQADIGIRRAVRKWLHLPADVPTAAFHASTKDGGLGVPSLGLQVPTVRRARYEKMLSESNHPLVAALRGQNGATTTDGARWTKLPSCLLPQVQDGVERNYKRAVREFHRGMLHSSVDGRGLAHLSEHPRSSAWVNDVSLSGLSGGEYVKAIHVRLACLRTRSRAARGRGSPDDRKCRLCWRRGRPMDVDNLAHRSQICAATHGLRVIRHDTLVRSMSRFFSRNWHVQVEPHLREVDRFGVKPDLVLTDSDTGRLVILDPSVVSDGHPLCVSAAEKARLYDRPDVHQAAWKHSKNEGNIKSVLALGLILSWRGAWLPDSYDALVRLRVGHRLLMYWTVKSLVSTWSLWHASENRTR